MASERGWRIRHPRPAMLYPWLLLLLAALVGFGAGAAGYRAGVVVGLVAAIGFLILGGLIFATTPRR